MNIIEKMLVLIIATIIHEIGHMLGALLVGIRINEASLGFGPTIAKFSIKNITFKISWIMLGAYVKPEKDNEDFLTYPRSSRIILTASGLIMSIFILPIISLLILNVLQAKSINIIPVFLKILGGIFNHPLITLDKGILMFPTLTYSNQIYNYIGGLAEISLFLGIFNLLPIPVLDGGQILMALIEDNFRSKKEKYIFWNKIGYLILLIIILAPMLWVFILNIKTMYPIFLLIGFLIYRSLKKNREYRDTSSEE